MAKCDLDSVKIEDRRVNRSILFHHFLTKYRALKIFVVVYGLDWYDMKFEDGKWKEWKEIGRW